jgi:hypothetical protein
MPTIAEFYGIMIMMFYRGEHNPPHFHAYYGEQEVVIEIATLRVMEGKMKPRTLSYVMEWAARHQAELTENWNRARRHEPLLTIIGLDQE